MASIANSDFENWNHGGPIIQDPADGQELADSWFWHKGSVSPTVQIEKVSSIHYSGSFSLGIEPGTSGFGGNSNTYVYQDITPLSDLQGNTIVVTCAVYSPSSQGTPAHIFVDDGITTVSSSSTPLDDAWHILSVTLAVSPSATRVRMGLMTDLYGQLIAYFDFANLSIAHVMNVFDTSTLAESLARRETKVVSESVSLTALAAKTPRKVVADALSLTASSSRAAIKQVQDVEIMSEVITISKILGPLDSVQLGEWVNIQLVPANRWTGTSY